MDDGVQASFERTGQINGVAGVTLDEARRMSGELLHVPRSNGGAFTQVIDDGDVIAGFQKDHAGLAADVAGAPGDEDFHGV